MCGRISGNEGTGDTMTRQEYIQELRDALNALHTIQNDSPPPKYDREWKAAMTKAERLLAMEPPKPKPIYPATYVRITTF
jgi:hypothetical protein